MTKKDNPLQQFYRVEKLHVKLPSRGIFYDQGVVDLSEDNDLGIKPMTAADELLLKNPDALLSGQAIIEVIRSCVPGVKKPQKLLSCDIDTIMIGIRDASYGDDLSVTVTCPQCGHENLYGINLEMLLNQSETLDDQYIAELGDDLRVYVKPGTFEAIIKKQRAMLEARKVERLLSSNESMGEEERLRYVSDIFNRMGRLNYELITDGVDKVEFINADGETVTVTESNHISDFLKNIDREKIDIIEDKLKEVNKVGISTTMPAVCTSCSHSWEAPIDFNPVNFS